IPVGTLTLFAGDAKLGKSLTMNTYVACTSSGTGMHGECPTRCGSVILLAAEDLVAQVVKPRLRVAGADLTKIHVIRSVLDPVGKEAWPALRQDIETIEEAARSLGDVVLIGIDPVTAYLAGVDDHKGTELRNVLLPLSRMAERLNIAVVLINHVGK